MQIYLIRFIIWTQLVLSDYAKIITLSIKVIEHLGRSE